VRSGDRTALPRAITLVESTRADHREQAQCLLLELMPDAGKAIQVGITGVPGVGKSTSIEALLPAVCHPWHHLSAVIYSPALRSGPSRNSELRDRRQPPDSLRAFGRDFNSGICPIIE
jgi:LAO/AO transport system kinase